ncbi:hypothetical protein [Chryseobacterium sp.]|uniref:hypothetical protein n=1 Tax=Chryseobacterium sp. TaxID=1871047 RepID=UPI0023F20E02|nr:hypothetical protein [Chryseobacterium sp.]
MKNQSFTPKIICHILLYILLFFCICCTEKIKEDNRFVAYQVNPEKQNIRLYWKNNKGEILKRLDHLKNDVQAKQEKLVFAMNGGMFEPDNSPKGLYIENSKITEKKIRYQFKGKYFKKI